MNIFTISDDKKALAGAYQMMMEMAAWKDLEEFADAERERSFQRSDTSSILSLSLAQVAEERGIRNGMMKLISYAKQKREGV